MPAPSRPESRRASRASSSDSMTKDRWMASSPENITVTQNRPGPTAISVSRSESRAKANTMRTRRAKGTTWLIPTRDRASTRRSLPATSAASRHMNGFLGGREQAAGHLSAGHGDRTGGDRRGPVQLVGGQQDGGPAGGGLLHDAVEDVAAGGVEAGVGLVEQPQLRAAGDDRGDRH